MVYENQTQTDIHFTQWKKSRNYDIQAYEIAPERIPYKVLNYTLSNLQTNIAQLDKDNDLIFIDVAGHLDNTKPIEIQEVTKALMYVDCLFIPFVSGGFNLDSTLEYYEFIKQVQILRAVQPRLLNVNGFINMNRQRTKANSILNDEIQVLSAKENLQMMQNSLNDYALFKEADTIKSLYDTYTEGSKGNFSTWLNEFLDIIKK